MSVPTDRQSLLAAWEAIGPCQPLPKEAEGVLLAYFNHFEKVDHNTIMTTPLCQHQLGTLCQTIDVDWFWP